MNRGCEAHVLQGKPSSSDFFLYGRVDQKYLDMRKLFLEGCCKWSLSMAVVGLMLLVGLWWNVKGRVENNYTKYLLKSLEGPIRYDDPCLVQYINEKILIPPSLLPYNVNKRRQIELRLNSEIFYARFLRLLFKSQTSGFFVEAGALDGMTMSNTLWLEKAKGWTGLLVEPDPANFVALKRVHRKSWIAKACLSMNKYPSQERLSSLDIVLNKHKDYDIKHRSMGSLVSQEKNNSFLHRAVHKDETANTYYTAQCLPLESFLVALNVTQVDLLSLDVENVEEEIIRNFDFSRFKVQVIFLEWWDFEKFDWLRHFLEEKGFMFVANKPGDVIFVRKNSTAAQIVDETMPVIEVNYFIEAKDN